MTSSRTSKLSKFFKSVYYNADCETNKVEQDSYKMLNSFWIKLLLPKRIFNMILKLREEIFLLQSRNNGLMDRWAEAEVNLATYRHNAEAQKAKTKKYSQMRKHEYECSLGKNCCNFHEEHEAGL